MQWVVQREDEHRATQAQLLGARRGVGERLQRREAARRTDHLLLYPAALEHPELLDATQMRAKRAAVETATAGVLGIEMANRMVLPVGLTFRLTRRRLRAERSRALS